MKGILIDRDSEGHGHRLVALLESDEWRELWLDVKMPVFTFVKVGLRDNAADNEVWQFCQNRELVLLTGNRNDDGPTSLEAVIRTQNRPGMLPVFTISDPKRLLANRNYADRIVAKLLENCYDIDKLLGTGRLFLP